MSKQVKCVLPSGVSRVLSLGPSLTLHTFQLVARNHLTRQCSCAVLRYGTPPHYKTVPLGVEECSVEMSLMLIGDHETVWIDVCPDCREKEVHRERHFDPNHPRTNLSKKLTTLEDIVTSTDLIPPFTEQTLGPGGYFYQIASGECELEHFSVYCFSNAPDTHFLYSACLDTLLELPRQLTQLKEERPIPQELMIPGGFLYQLLSTHASMKHMNFYTLGILPGRILVYDAGLDMLTETHLTSALTRCLFPSSTSPDVTASHVTEEVSMPLSPNGVARTVFCHKLAICTLQCTAPSQHLHMRGVVNCDPGGTSHESTGLVSANHHCTNHPQAILVHEPCSLDLSVPHSTLETRCHIPPCMYLGEESDPR